MTDWLIGFTAALVILTQALVALTAVVAAKRPRGNCQEFAVVDYIEVFYDRVRLPQVSRSTNWSFFAWRGARSGWPDLAAR
ncbi:MAG TPA: hypothetical protein VGA04_10900 [Streptosporangiaceae bacterium]